MNIGFLIIKVENLENGMVIKNMLFIGKMDLVIKLEEKNLLKIIILKNMYLGHTLLVIH